MGRTNRYKKMTRRVLVGAGVLLMLLAVFVFIAPRLINLESVRRMIITEISGKIGGEVDFQKIRLSFLPLPHLAVYRGRLNIPEAVNGKLTSLAVYPQIMPLLTGHIRISKISLLQPDLNIIVAGKDKTDHRKHAAPVSIKEKAAPLVGALAALGPDLEIVIKDGRLNIAIPKIPALKFTGMDIHLQVPPDRLNFEVESASNFCSQISLKGEITLESLKSRGQINLTEFRPHLLARNLIPPEIIGLGESQLDLGLKYEADALDKIKGEFESSQFDLALKRGQQAVVLKGQGLKGSFNKDKKSIRVSLTQLSLDNPGLKLAGNFLTDPVNNKAELELNGRDVDVGSLRRSALALAGDISAVKDIFDILKQGTVPAVNFTVAGQSIRDLAEFENMTIRGSMLQGEVLVPEVDLNATDVNGKVLISKGLLNVENIKARYGETRVHDGRLRLGLVGKKAPFHLDIGLAADLSQVPGILKRVIADPSVTAEINRLRRIGGRADGRLVLGERLDAIRATVQVDHFNVNARVDSIPYPLELKGSGFSYAGRSMEMQALTGTMKSSSLSLSSVRLDWEKTPVIALRSQKGSIDLKELYSWLASDPNFNKALAHLQALDGSVKLLTLKLSGPLLKPLQWNFDAAGRMTDIKVRSDLLPESLVIKKGKFILTPQVFAIADAEAGSMDAALKVAGRLDGYLEGVNGLEINFNGKVGEKANQWLLKQAKIPSYLLIRPPLLVSNGRFAWDRKGRTTIAGDLNIHNDISVTGEVLFEPRSLFIKKLVVQDKHSRAFFALNLQKDRFILNFKGNLEKAAVDKLLADNKILNGWIKGDLRLDYFLERPRGSRFEGNLSGKDLVLFQRFQMPLKVDSFSVSGRKNKFRLEADMRLQADRRLSLKGDVNYSAKGVFFDAALDSDGIELDRLAGKLNRDRNKEKKAEKEKKTKEDKFWHFPLAGHLKLNSTYLRYKQYDLRPFGADIDLRPEKITLAVSDANLCGVSIPGTLTLRPRDIRLDFKPVAQNQEFQSAAICLKDKEAKLEGRFNLSGEISGGGPAAELKKSLQANFELDTSPGRILAGRSYRTLKEILELINITEIYKGKLPDLTREGFAYNSIRAKMNIRNNILTIDEGFIDGLTMNVAGKGTLNLADKRINLTVLAAPLKTVDTIVSKIPLVGYILDGTLITIPVSVTGSFDQPKVSLLPPSAVGEGLVGIMKRTLQLPIKILEPVVK